MSVVQMQKKALYSLCIAIAALFMVSGCAAKYTIKTESISGEVVDAETNEPIEDVIVIGYWPGYTFYLHASSAPTIEVLETTTDKYGNFLVPGWLKKNVESSFRYGDPQMVFYKTGYEIKTVRNAFSMENFKIMPGYFHPWRAEWNDKTIKIKKFEGDNRAYRKYLNGVQFRPPFENLFKHCKYMNVPRLLIAMEEYYLTHPDYRVPGRTLQVSDASVTTNYRGPGNMQMNSSVKQSSKLDDSNLNKKPLPSILTITQLENLGVRCEVTPIEYLIRITSNEKDFIRSSNHATPANK